jgi:methionyl-tRNA formyltransferase
MRYVFFGGRESRFAQIVLDGLKNMGLKPVAEIRDAKAPLDIEYLQSLHADFFLVASFAKILKQEVISIPPRGTIGIHPSLLPKYRGASPIQSVLLNDEKETGTTLFLIDEKVDHGPIVSGIRCQVSSEDTYISLEEKLAKLSAELAIEILPKYLAGKIQPQIQDEAQATFTKKFKTEDAEVNLKTDDPKMIWLKIRALNPEPGVYTILKLKNDKSLRLKLLEATYENEKLILTKVQPEGKKPMSYQAFLNGYQRLIS